MSAKQFEGEYVKVQGVPTFWLVRGGKRIKLNSKEDWWDIGLLPVNKVTPEELEKIPYSHDWGDEPPSEVTVTASDEDAEDG